MGKKKQIWEIAQEIGIPGAVDFGSSQYYDIDGKLPKNFFLCFKGPFTNSVTVYRTEWKERGRERSKIKHTHKIIVAKTFEDERDTTNAYTHLKKRRMGVEKLDCHRYGICERLEENRFIIFFSRC